MTSRILTTKPAWHTKKLLTLRWNTKFQLVPPYMHPQNQAEHTIRTFKDRFLAILANVDSAFPTCLWDLLLPQAELTLNLLRQAMLNPRISAWEFFQGPFDFNRTPLGPVACCILIHAKPATRQSWDFRAKPGFYIGPALNSYRCFKLVKTDTKSQVILDTIKFCICTSPSWCLLQKIRSYMAYRSSRVLSKAHHLPQVSPSPKQLLHFKKALSHGTCLLPHLYGQTTAQLPIVQG